MRKLLAAAAVATALAVPAAPAAAAPCFSFYYYRDLGPVSVGPYSQVVCVPPLSR
jgi:hypothetical protein